MTDFRYLRASEWGIRWARPPVTERTPDAETYVHHSAGSVPADAVTAFRALNEHAINVKGYSAVDYDIMVHRNPNTGVVTIGGGREGYMSAATLDRNEQGEAVCVLGYFHPNHSLSRRPHPDEVEGCARGIAWGIAHGWIDPATVILGHRDNPAHPGATACPGDYLQAELPTIRRRVAELLNPQEGWTMRPESRRVLDTRNPPARFADGETRSIPIGMATEALLRIQVVNPAIAGWVSLDGGKTSVVNYWPGQHVSSDLAYTALDVGKVNLMVSGACDVIVDVQGIG